MANQLLTPSAITRRALLILHQKLNFIGSINRQYDDSYAVEGAKIGNALRIRLPNQYSVVDGAALGSQDTVEEQVTLTVSARKHVPMSFTSEDLTLDLDDFAERILEPAMSVLASVVEADALSMYKDVYQQVANIGNAATFIDVLNGRKLLTDALAPSSQRSFCMDTQFNVDVVNELKGLFQDSTQIAKQYREGYVGRTSGFDFMENTLMPRHVSGTNAGTGYLVNGATQTGSSLTVDTGSGTFTKGDILTIAGVFRVHPETKQNTGILQQFVVTADYAGGAGSVPISPAIVTTGARQTVSNSPADNAAITKVGGNAATHNVSLAYHRDAFAFATADLVMPQGVDFSAREVMDGLSMRVVRDYDINSDAFPCRVDILYGYQTIRAQLAAREAFN